MKNTMLFRIIAMLLFAFIFPNRSASTGVSRSNTLLVTSLALTF